MVVEGDPRRMALLQMQKNPRPGGSASAGSRMTFPKKEKLMKYPKYPHFLKMSCKQSNH